MVQRIQNNNYLFNFWNIPRVAKLFRTKPRKKITHQEKIKQMKS